MDDGDARAEIEAQLDEFYGTDDSDEKSERRQSIFQDDGTINTFQRSALAGQVRRHRAEQVQSGDASAIPSVPPEFAQDIPDPVEGYDDRIDLVTEVKGVVNIQTAVANWGKPQNPPVKWGGRTEGIHIRCPFPHHPDENPSAWVNVVKHTWFCGACQEGGDQIDFFAAARYGMNSKEAHTKEKFPEVLAEMARELGIDPDPPQQIPPDDPPQAVKPEPPGPVVPPTPVQAPEPPPDEPNEPTTISVEQVTQGIDPDSLQFDPRDDSDPFDIGITVPTYDWKNLDIPQGTFLYELMWQADADWPDIPPEFFLILGFQAVGLACGQDLITKIRKRPLTGSMMVAIVAPSGMGKSTAKNQIQEMFRVVPGPKRDNSLGTGIKIIGTPGSPEALVVHVRTDIKDPGDPTRTIEVPTTAWLVEDEFATFVSRAQRKGMSHIKSRLIMFSDWTKSSDEPELVIEDFSITNGHREVHDSFFSATFLTQTDALREHIQNVDISSGFFQRIHPVFGGLRGGEDLTQDIDEDPQYRRFYERLWKWCRASRRVLPLSDKSVDYMNHHATLEEMRMIGMEHPIFSRLRLFVYRFAFLLAVNEQSEYVEPRHCDLAMHLVDNYTRKCFAHLVNHAKATEVRDARDRVLSWVSGRYDRTGKWPSRGELSNQHFWKNIPIQQQDMILNNLASNHEMVRVVLQDIGTKRETHTLVVTNRNDEWAKYANRDYSKFEREKFYARSSP